MKKLNIILLAITSIFITNNINAQDSTNAKINWMTFEEAVKLNETAPKKIFIDVYTDWCGWCTKMDQTTFIDPAIVEYMNDNFYAVKFNAEQKEPVEFMGYTFINEAAEGAKRSTHQLAAALLQGKMSYPSYVFMNEKNQAITVVPGYSKAEEFITILRFIGSDAFLTTPWEEFSKSQAQ